MNMKNSPAVFGFWLACTMAPALHAQTATPVKPNEANEEVVILSPFEVVSATKGYFASNTMSGTRLNSKIEDLGQSITVMTKEQMSDFGMLDINDVFDYMASTEGTNSYSQFDTDRTGAVVDQVSLNPNNANRVRGIGNANVAFNNIQTSGRVPVDPLWMDSLELSRGPNANIFGLGNAAGTVNQTPATANLSRNFSKVEVRGDSYDGWRASIDVNRELIKNKLAARASYANQHTGFVRKPSGEDARRLSFQVKARPFKNTTLSGSWYNYKNASVRSNFTTPRDYFTNWINAGQPAWNPITGLVTLANGKVYGNGNVLGSTTPYTSTPSFFSGVDKRSTFRIGAPGETPSWVLPRYTSGAAAATDPFASQTGVGLLYTLPTQPYSATQQPLWNSLINAISDRAIYDYAKINLNANNKAWDNVNTYMAQLDQIILNTPKQTLALQATFMRENAKRLENQPFGPASVNSAQGQIIVDVNKVNLDGSPNPYFGRPYLRAEGYYLRDRPLLWDTTRAQVVYRLDFSHNEGWSKWLGTQQLLGYDEYKDQQNRRYTYRRAPTGTNLAWEQKYRGLKTLMGNGGTSNTNPAYPITPGNFAQLAEQYFVGSTPGGGIEYAPSFFPEGASIPFVWGSSATTMNKDATTVGFIPSPDSGGGAANVQEIVKTTGGVLQSTFLDGRLVGTFGLRQDKVYDRNAPLATFTPDLHDYDFAASDRWVGPWRPATGKTKTSSIVARPLRDLKFLRPQAGGGASVSRFLAEAVSSLSLTYNRSDNFIAQGPAYDLYLKPLPNQTGTSKDLGFWMTMLDGRVSIRYTHFVTKQRNLRNGDITTMLQRLFHYEGFGSTDAFNLRSQVIGWLGGSPTDAQIAAAFKMPVERYTALTALQASGAYAASMDMESKGDELELNFNPTRNWTVSASVTKTQVINTAVGSEVDDYLAERMPIWLNMEDPRFTRANDPTGTIPTGATGHLLWWYILGPTFNTAAGYSSTASAASTFAGNMNAPMAVFRQMVGRPRPQVREYSAKFNTKYNLSGITDNRILKNMSVGGSLRRASKGAIGFYGLGYDPAKDLKLPANTMLQLDPKRPVYAPPETYVDLFASYKTKLFSDRIRAAFQLNVKNVQENGGRLQATSTFPDGTASTYRIVDPRQFILSASFDL